jgi:hypothetical protein
VIALVVLWRLRYKLALRDLPEMFLIRGIVFSHEGPDIDDLAYLADIEQSRAFCPAQTVLVLNEGLIRDARPREPAFAEVREHSVYKAALKRGAREVWFPKLACMQEVNTRRMLFAAAEKSLGLTNRQRVSIWRREVEKELTPVADWLP